jgi:choline kinase
MLGICVPVRDTLHTGFAYCLVQLTSHLTKNNIDYKLYFENGSIISDQRYRLATSAMSDMCTQILWLDSDMLFPVSIYERLNNHNKMAVAATYSTRTKPYRNTAFKSDKFDTVDNNSGLHSVYAVGMGLMLIDISIFKTIPRPWFQVTWSEQHETFTGEDVYFCSQLHNYEYKLYVDFDLSKNCGHIGSIAIKMENIND